MYLRKIVDSTVDKLTLSYIEKHLKEALESEGAIPTTVLSVIAEKSFNEYNMKSISNFLDKSFRLDYKDWKRFRNLLKIIEYLLKFGSNEFITLAKQHSSNIRSLQNYSFTEAGVDRGSPIRENALMILGLLNNARELDMFREESRRHREKFTGISSNPSENQGYGGSSYGSSGYAGSSYGNSGSSYGNSGSSYGNSGSSYGNSGSSYGNSGSSYGNSGSSYGNSGSSYGNSGPSFGNSGPSFGNSGPSYGNSGSSYGNSGSSFGNSGYTGPGYGNSGYGGGSENNTGYTQNNFKSQKSEGLIYREDQKKFAESIFGGKVDTRGENRDIFGSEAKKYANEGYSQNFESFPQSANSKSSDIFRSKEAGHSNSPAVLFSDSGKVDLFSVNKTPNLFSTKQETLEYYERDYNDQRPKTEGLAKPDLFSGVNRKDPKVGQELTYTQQSSKGPGYDLFETKSKASLLPEKSQFDLLDPLPEVSSARQQEGLFDQTPTTLNPQKSSLFDLVTVKPQQANLFESVTLKPQQPDLLDPVSSSNSLHPDLFDLVPPSSKPQPSLFESNPKPQRQEIPSSLFSGMTQKRQSEPESSFSAISLESLSLSFNSNPAPAGPKIKSNLAQVEEKKRPEPAGKKFDPSEFEEKLFSLDLNS